MSFGPVKIKERKRTYSHCVDVDVDVSLSELPTEDLMLELKDRGELRDQSAEHAEVLEMIAAELRRGAFAEALLIIDRCLAPKWNDEKHALEDYVKAMGRPPLVAALS